MKLTNIKLGLFVVASLSLGLSSCQEKSTSEEVAEEIEETTDEAGDAVEEAGDAVQDTVEDATE